MVSLFLFLQGEKMYKSTSPRGMSAKKNKSSRVSAAKAVSKIKSANKQNSILIVEDEMILATNTKMSLEDAGHRVSGIAITGEDALSMIEKEKPDLAIVDITLRGEMDGIAAARTMIEEYGIPVIYVTGNADEGTLERARQTNPAGILQKPIDDNKLVSVIEEALGS